MPKIESFETNGGIEFSEAMETYNRFQIHPNITFAHFLEAMELRDWKPKVNEIKAEIRESSRVVQELPRQYNIEEFFSDDDDGFSFNVYDDNSDMEEQQI